MKPQLYDLQIHNVNLTPILKMYRVTLEDLQTKEQTKLLAEARAACMYALLKIGFSKSNIGKFFCRDHSTVISSCRSIEGYIDTYPLYKHLDSIIQSMVKSNKDLLK